MYILQWIVLFLVITYNNVGLYTNGYHLVTMCLISSLHVYVWSNLIRLMPWFCNTTSNKRIDYTWYSRGNVFPFGSLTVHTCYPSKCFFHDETPEHHLFSPYLASSKATCKMELQGGGQMTQSLITWTRGHILETINCSVARRTCRNACRGR